MKNSTFLIILLAAGLVFVSYKWITAAADKDSTCVSAQSTTLNDIMTRMSVRSYTDQPVTNEQIDTLLKAAMAAPTAGNKQPWRFVVINDKKILNHIADNFEPMQMMKEAAVAVVVCGDSTASFPGEGREYWVQDASAASENLLLAAHAMGLGAVWCGVYPVSERVKAFSELLKLPSNILPLNCIAVGYPSGENTPKDKWKPENVHYNSWGTDSVKQP